MRIISGYQYIRNNDEDFILTPFLALVFVKGKIFSVYGISINWFWWSFYVGLGFGIPKVYPTFTNLNKHKDYF